MTPEGMRKKFLRLRMSKLRIIQFSGYKVNVFDGVKHVGTFWLQIEWTFESEPNTFTWNQLDDIAMLFSILEGG